MKRATLDTNIFISALLYNGNERRVLEAAIRGDYKLITSLPILDEVEEVLRRLGIDEKEIEGYILRLMEISEIVVPERIEETPLRDRDDIKILECAVSGSSNYIITGDQDLLTLTEYRGIRILRSIEFLNMIKNNN